MHSRSKFVLLKVLELVELCADKQGRVRSVNMRDFCNALDAWQIGWKKAYAALAVLEQRNILLTMTRREDGEISEIIITPATYRCHHCRLVVSSQLDWEDHLPDCRRQQARMRRLGLIA